MTLGKFITLEGTEGAGKSTAQQFIYDYLMQVNKDMVLTREPGGTDIAEAIREILLHPKTSEIMSSDTELLLLFASRAQLIKQVIRPNLQLGKWILCDRYIDTTYAYQGGGRQIDMRMIQTLDSLVVNDLYPDLTILLDIPAELGVMRAEKRGQGKDRIEQEKVDFFIRAREVFLARAAREPNRIVVIDASQELPAVKAQLRDTLDHFLKRVSA